MDIRKLQRAIVDGLEDVKAQHIAVFNTEHLSPLFERVIIASGTSNRQTKALAAGVRDAVRSRGLQVLRTEGEDNGEWIIVDCGAAVVHIMQPSIREYYRLEEIWGGKAVKMKLDGAAAAGLPKAGDDSDDEPAPKTAKKTATKKAAAKTSATKRSTAKKSTAKESTAKESSAKDSSTRTSAPTTSAPGKRAATRPAAKKATAGKTAAKKAAPRKTASTRTAATKAPARKPAARNTPARAPAAKKSARRGA